MMNEYGKSDSSIVPEKLPNKVCKKAAEAMEERELAKGNTFRQNHTGHGAGTMRKVRLNGYAEQQK
jgi:hypothetical protein